MKVLQYQQRDGRHLAVVDDDGGIIDVAGALRTRGLPPTFTGALAAAKKDGHSLGAVVRELVAGSDETNLRWDPADAVVVDGSDRFPLDVPVDAPETWASGVTYLRSRTARIEESGAEAKDFYDRVYEAERPELFMKDADCRRTVASGAFIGVRGDSTWTVPEPELALVLDAQGTIVGYTVGDDVTARDVEAQNPLYLPQAKVFTRSCSLGPLVLIAEEGDPSPDFTIHLRILEGDGRQLYRESIATSSMKRSLHELTDYLMRYNTIADGTVLLTGTGVVPPDDYALRGGHRVEVEIEGIGTLWNPVEDLQ